MILLHLPYARFGTEANSPSTLSEWKTLGLEGLHSDDDFPLLNDTSVRLVLGDHSNRPSTAPSSLPTRSFLGNPATGRRTHGGSESPHHSANPHLLSTGRCVRAARAIYDSLMLVKATSFDITKMHPFVTVCTNTTTHLNIY